MTDFANKVVTTIQKRQMKPLARWIFVLRNSGLSLALLAILGCSAATIALLIHLVRTNDWDAYQEVGGSLGNFILTTLPHVWLAVLAICLWGLYGVFAHTPFGYRYRVMHVAVVGLLSVSLSGTGMYAAGLGEDIDTAMEETLPAPYYRIIKPQAATWQQPAKGHLGGTIVKTSPASTQLIDTTGKIWTILTDVSAQNMTTTPEGGVRLIGTLVNSSTFSIRAALPARAEKKNKPSIQAEKAKKTSTQGADQVEPTPAKILEFTTSSQTRKEFKTPTTTEKIKKLEVAPNKAASTTPRKRRIPAFWERLLRERQEQLKASAANRDQ